MGLKKKYVWAKIPRAGLANKILVWANALVFARQNKAELTVTNWLSLFIGPMLRGERSLRFYLGYFKEDSWIKKVQIRLIAKVYPSEKNIQNDSFPMNKPLVVFDTYMDWIVFFDRIRDHRAMIKDEFLNGLLKKKYYNTYKHSESPQIGVHIRMGDFTKFSGNEGEFHHEVAHAKQTPVSYFKEVISFTRGIVGWDIPVIVFSDGSDGELSSILSMKKVKRSHFQKDIEDLLWLSRSQMIVTSASSTFSLFAAYLSEAMIIHHPNFYIRPVRDTEINTKFFEGPFDKQNEILIKQLKDKWGGVRGF